MSNIIDPVSSSKQTPVSDQIDSGFSGWLSRQLRSVWVSLLSCFGCLAKRLSDRNIVAIVAKLPEDKKAQSAFYQVFGQRNQNREEFLSKLIAKDDYRAVEGYFAGNKLDEGLQPLLQFSAIKAAEAGSLKTLKVLVSHPKFDLQGRHENQSFVDVLVDKELLRKFLHINGGEILREDKTIYGQAVLSALKAGEFNRLVETHHTLSQEQYISGSSLPFFLQLTKDEANKILEHFSAQPDAAEHNILLYLVNNGPITAADITTLSEERKRKIIQILKPISVQEGFSAEARLEQCSTVFHIMKALQGYGEFQDFLTKFLEVIRSSDMQLSYKNSYIFSIVRGIETPEAHKMSRANIMRSLIQDVEKAEPDKAQLAEFLQTVASIPVLRKDFQFRQKLIEFFKGIIESPKGVTEGDQCGYIWTLMDKVFVEQDGNSKKKLKIQDVGIEYTKFLDILGKAAKEKEGLRDFYSSLVQLPRE